MKNENKPITTNTQVEVNSKNSEFSYLPFQRSNESFLIKHAVNISFFSNIILLIAKIFALFLDFKLVLLASTLDSALDVLSGSILWIANRLMKISEPLNYPAGKSRFEPIGIIVFATIMSTSSLQIIMFSSYNLAENIGTYSLPLAPSISVIIITFFVICLKVILYILCKMSSNSIAKTYARDHFNDLLLNGFTLGVLITISFKPNLWWLDDGGAIFIALYIFYNWIKTGIDQVKLLAAYSADDENYKSLSKSISTFDEEVSIYDLKAYYFGPRFIVEVIIRLPPDRSLIGSQKLILGLKQYVEKLDIVERCFVSVDYIEEPNLS